MTKNNECAGTYSVSGYSRSDGTKVSGYSRTCGAKHNSSADIDYEDKMQRRAELLFPNTPNKKKTIDTQTIAGVHKGLPMTFEEAGS